MRPTIKVKPKNALRGASPAPDPVTRALSEVPMAALQCALDWRALIFVEETPKGNTRGPKAPPPTG